MRLRRAPPPQKSYPFPFLSLRSRPSGLSSKKARRRRRKFWDLNQQPAGGKLDSCPQGYRPDRRIRQYFLLLFCFCFPLTTPACLQSTLSAVRPQSAAVKQLVYRTENRQSPVDWLHTVLPLKPRRVTEHGIYCSLRSSIQQALCSPSGTIKLLGDRSEHKSEGLNLSPLVCQL